MNMELEALMTLSEEDRMLATKYEAAGSVAFTTTESQFDV